MKRKQKRTAGVGAKAPAPVAVNKQLAALYARWREGAQLFALAAEAGLKRSKFRRMMIAQAGGKAAFAAARASGAGGQRAVGVTPSAAIAISDANVKFLKTTGWTDRNVYVPKMVRITLKDEHGRKSPLTVPWRECIAKVFISPKGNEYVRALPTEPADARLRIWLGETESIVRLKRYTGSRTERRVEASEADAEQLAAKVAHIQERDRTKRVVRRKARLHKKRRTR